MSEPREYCFYTTLGCHLCELAEEVISSLLEQNPAAAIALRIEVVDIAESDDLIQQYGEHIPVLKSMDSGRQLGWPFNTAQLAKFLNEDSAYR